MAESIDIRKEVWGRVSYVEPTNTRVETFLGEDHIVNAQSNEAILNPLEDYCIAVDLEVCIPDRRSCGFAEENGCVKYLEFSSTKRTISFMNGTNGTLTTNFTDVTSLNPNDSTAECLGIENIDISFDSWLYPQVTIRFVDVRGAALMMPEEVAYQDKKDYIQSVYTALFSIPYPIFKLKIKGFYGLGATYYLCPEDTHIELDAATGNFILTVKFIGHRFRIYADLPMSYICVAPYMEEGSLYWERQTSGSGPFKFRNADKTETPMMKFVEVRTKVADAIHSELQGKLASNRVKTENSYKAKENALASIKEGCPVMGGDWFSDTTVPGRYYSIIKGKSGRAEFAKEVEEYCKKVDEYDKKYTKEGDPKIISNFDYLIPFESKSKINEITYNGKGSYSDDKFMEDPKNAELKRKADAKVTELSDEDKKKNRRFVILVLDGNVNDKKKLEDFINGGIDAEIAKIVKNREDSVKELKNEEEVTIEKALGFTPSIQNIFQLAFAHMDTFMHCFNERMHNIEAKMNNSYDSTRKISTFVNSDNITSDIDTDLVGKSLPPFPMFYKHAETENLSSGPMEQIWPGKLPGGEELDEVELVDDLITASHIYFNKNKELDEKIAQYKEAEAAKNSDNEEENTNGEDVKVAEVVPIESPLAKIDKFIPLTTFDLARKGEIDNPYSYIAKRVYDGSKDGMPNIGRDILTTFMIRAIYYLSTSETSHNIENSHGRNSRTKNEAQAFGDAEAVNFAKAISEDFTNAEFREFITKYANTKNENAVLEDIINSAKIGPNKQKIFGLNNNLVSFDFPAVNDKSSDVPNKIPIGKPAISAFEGDILSGRDNGKNYLPERESSTDMPETSTFFLIDDKNYIPSIRENVKKLAEGLDGEKYKIKNTKIAEEIADNVDVFTEEDSNLGKIIANKSNGKLVKKASEILSIINRGVVSATDSHIIKIPYRDGFSANPKATEKGNIWSQNMGDDTTLSLAYLYLIGLNTVVPSKKRTLGGRKPLLDEWQPSGIQRLSSNGVVLKSALLKEGAFYWRAECMENGEDPIKHNGFRAAAANEIYCYTNSKNRDKDIKDGGTFGGITTNDNKKKYISWEQLPNVTASRKKKLKDEFLVWANGEFADALKYITLSDLYDGNTSTLDYKCFSDETRMVNGGDGTSFNLSIAALKMQMFLMKTFFEAYTVLDLYAGRAPMENNDYSTCKFYAGKAPLAAALDSFMKALARIYKKDIKDDFVNSTTGPSEERQISQIFKNTDLRLATYQTLKALYDKWLCAPFNGENTWKFLGPDATQGTSDSKANESEFSNFVFIDSFYRKIGRRLPVNISNVMDWIGACLPNVGNGNDDSISAANAKSVHDFLCDTATGTGGILLSFPQSMAERSTMNVAKMFTPYSFNDDWQTDSSSFVFIYTYKMSEHLGTNQYPDDGFQLVPEVATLVGDSVDSNTNGYQIPAFGVTYGKQNQSIFKNITLTTQNSNVTEAAIAATMAIASKGSTGARESRFLGQDIYRVKTAYSYQCEFDMMGCAQIMPLMYFQLNNIPFWRGAYMVIKVQHRISQGEMVTHVTGVRLNRYMLPWVEGELIPSDDDMGDGGSGTLGATKTRQVPGTSHTGTVKDTPPNPKYALPNNGKDIWTVKDGNVSETKPVISVWPAHGPNTEKSCEWDWSSHLVDDYIIPLLKVFDFADGTPFGDNIQRCNVNGAHTGTGYSSEQTRNLVAKYGSKQVVSLVPHWNALGGKSSVGQQYFMALPGWFKYYGNPSKEQEQRRADSTKLAFYAAREAWKLIDRKEEFKSMPVGAVGSIGSNTRNNSDFPIKNGPVHVQSHWSGGKDKEYGDPAFVPNCACLLTENWFRTYRVSGEPMPPETKAEWDANKSTYMTKDDNGRYKTMQAWLWSNEGSTAVGYLNAMAIVNYIASLGENNAPVVNEKRLSELKKKNSYLVEKFRKWFSEANK